MFSNLRAASSQCWTDVGSWSGCLQTERQPDWPPGCLVWRTGGGRHPGAVKCDLSVSCESRGDGPILFPPSQNPMEWNSRCPSSPSERLSETLHYITIIQGTTASHPDNWRLGSNSFLFYISKEQIESSHYLHSAPKQEKTSWQAATPIQCVVFTQPFSPILSLYFKAWKTLHKHWTLSFIYTIISQKGNHWAKTMVSNFF